MIVSFGKCLAICSFIFYVTQDSLYIFITTGDQAECFLKIFEFQHNGFPQMDSFLLRLSYLMEMVQGRWCLQGDVILFKSLIQGCPLLKFKIASSLFFGKFCENFLCTSLIQFVLEMARIPDDPEVVKHVCFQCRMLPELITICIVLVFAFCSTLILNEMEGKKVLTFYFNDCLLWEMFSDLLFYILRHTGFLVYFYNYW